MRYMPKCSQPIRLQDFLINYISKQINEITWFLAWPNGCGQSGHRTLKLAVSQWIDEMNWFLACWCKFKKAKSYFNDFWVGRVKNYGTLKWVKNGWGNLVHETLKFAEWVYGLRWFFACWLWCNNFWLDHLVYCSCTC